MAPQQSGESAGGEGADLEQAQPEHRIGHAGLDPQNATSSATRRPRMPEHERIRPAHGVTPVRLYPVHDAGQDCRQPEREGDVPEPVDASRARTPLSTA